MLQFTNIRLALPSLLLIQLFSFTAFSSTPDSTKVKSKNDSSLVYYFYNDVEKFGTIRLHPNDTAITGFQNYDPLYKTDHFFATLGNIGSANRNLVPYSILGQSGFDYGNHTLDDYLYENDSVKYYRVIKTFTDLTYVQGAKKENMFHAIFSRNIYRSLNLGFDFRVFNSPGAYQRQRTNHINFYLTAQFLTKDRRYGVIANFLIDRLKNNENGGIQNDTLFEQNIESNRQIYTVNLNGAQNRVRETGFFMKHYFNLTRHPRNAKDTTLPVKKRVELGRLSYSFQYNRQIQNYIDYLPKSGFYKNFYIDTISTYDSITISKIENEIIWTNPSFRPDKKFRVLQVEARLKQIYAEVTYHDIRRIFLQYIPRAEISFHPLSTLLLYAYGDYVFGDYNQGDLNLKANLSQTLGSTEHNAGTVTLKGAYCFQKPGWFYEHYLGNNFKWDTTWKRENLISAGFSYNIKSIEAGFNVSRINHFVYLDTAALPQQENNEIGYIYAYLNGAIDLWKFKLKGQFAYQTVQGKNVLRLPAFIGNLAIYFTQELFHGAATLQPGLNFFYNTLYYADAYMPATRSFFLQDKKQLGNYLYMDVFINLKIQRARFFVMYSHFNSSFMGYHYYMVPTYPMQDAAFKFGITWNFHD